MPTTSRLKQVAGWAWFPWLMGLYPITFLYERNMALVPMDNYFSLLGWTLLAVTLVMVLFWLITRKIYTSAAMASLAAIIFFSAGHLWNLLPLRENPDAVGQSQVFAIIWALIGVFGVILVGLSLSDDAAKRAAPSINLVAVLLLLFPLIRVGQFMLGQSASTEQVLAGAAGTPKVMNDSAHPDIYYIILDGYSANKHLMRSWGYDNSAFTQALEERGFTIAYDSQTNYAMTLPSMASSLNMRYLTEQERPLNDPTGVTYARKLIADSLVARELVARGYTYVFLMSGWSRPSTIADMNIEIYEDGPVVYGKGEMRADDLYYQDSLWPLLVDTTLLRNVITFDEQPSIGAGKEGGPLEYRDPRRALILWEEAPKIAQMPEATFTVVHIMKPHAPIRFDRDGNLVADPPRKPADRRQRMWFEQLHFVNQQTLDMIDTILADSTVEPIIFIQGDHGTNLGIPQTPDLHRTYFEILNAYRFPNGGGDAIYQTISPVNSFRVMFNTYFGEDYDLLPDDGRYEPISSYNNVFDFLPATQPPPP
jgi:hypothetical protein